MTTSLSHAKVAPMRPELAAHLLDVRHRPLAGVDAALDRGVLGGQPERVEADRQEHVVPVHPPVAGDGVRGGHDVPVADVQRPRRVRVHRQQVEARPRVIVEIRVVEAEIGPLRLPRGFDRRVVVALDASPLVAGHGLAGGLAVACRRHVTDPSDETRPPAGPGEGSDDRRYRGVGGATGVRTPDLLNAIQTLSQLSYSPTPEAEYTARPRARDSRNLRATPATIGPCPSTS